MDINSQFSVLSSQFPVAQCSLLVVQRTLIWDSVPSSQFSVLSFKLLVVGCYFSEKRQMPLNRAGGCHRATEQRAANNEQLRTDLRRLQVHELQLVQPAVGPQSRHQV